VDRPLVPRVSIAKGVFKKGTKKPIFIRDLISGEEGGLKFSGKRYGLGRGRPEARKNSSIKVDQGYDSTSYPHAQDRSGSGDGDEDGRGLIIGDILPIGICCKKKPSGGSIFCIGCDCGPRGKGRAEPLRWSTVERRVRFAVAMGGGAVFSKK